MTAEIVCIGTELLIGQVTNTNASYLARELNALGVSVYHQVVVGDNTQRMREAILQAMGRADVVITTGGLGPTEDDLSKEVVAEALGLPMEEDAASLEAIRERFAAMGRPMGENNRKQARFARGAHILANAHGTAPGCIVRAGKKAVVQLPGPPRELIPMFRNGVAPYLISMEGTHNTIFSQYVRIFGMGESDVAAQIADLIAAQGEVTIAPYCSLGEVQLRVTASAPDAESAGHKMRPTLETLQERLGGMIYAITEDADDSMANQAARALIERHKTVALAESLTGGMVTAALVDIPGVSEALMEGLVTYSNEAKMRLLGVTGDTLRQYGAVSEECAREMAEGLRARSGVDIAVSTTGIAGPDGGTPEKPAGLVYIGISTAQGTRVTRLQLFGGRERVRTMTKLHALHQLMREAKQ